MIFGQSRQYLAEKSSNLVITTPNIINRGFKIQSRNKLKKPTEALYQSLQVAYQHFNNSLFDGVLPDVLFTVQRQAGMLGYFVPDRWTSPDGDFCHEISINPQHMGTSRLIDVLQTLVHEMVHCWQFCFGTPSSQGYHNKEWAYKMMEIGLQPSSTGKPGGDIVGMSMSDYPIEDGPFWLSSLALIENEEFRLPWIYRLSIAKTSEKPSLPQVEQNQEFEGVFAETITNDTDHLSITSSTVTPESLLFSNYKDLMPENTFFSPPSRAKTKSKYQCPSCKLNVWGKPNIKVMCVECSVLLLEI